MQSAGSLAEPGLFPGQVHRRIGQDQAFRFRNNEYPYVKSDPEPARMGGGLMGGRRQPDGRGGRHERDESAQHGSRNR